MFYNRIVATINVDLDQAVFADSSGAQGGLLVLNKYSHMSSSAVYYKGR